MIGFIESPLAFFQKPVKAIFSDAVEASQVSPRFIPKVLNSVDVVTASRQHGLARVDAFVPELGDVQHVSGLKHIHIDDAVRRYILPNDGDYGLGISLRDDHRTYLVVSHE